MQWGEGVWGQTSLQTEASGREAGGHRHPVSICTGHPSWWGGTQLTGPCLCPQGTPENPGINQRALQLLFSEVQEKASDWEFTITVSAAEIYNEALRLEAGGGGG